MHRHHRRLPGALLALAVAAALSTVATPAAAAPRSVQVEPGVPAQVTGVTAAPAAADPKGVLVSWTAADGNGGPVTGYTITADPGGAVKQVPGDATSAVVTPVDYGTAYTFTVAAANETGTGPASEPSNAVTRTAPDTAKPVVTFVSTPAVATTSRTAYFSFAGTDPDRPDAVLTYHCSLSGHHYGGCTSPQEYHQLPEGEHRFWVVATDEAGNASAPALYEWLIDRTAPFGLQVPTQGVTYGENVVARLAAQDSLSGVGSYDLRYRVAPYDAPFGALRYPATMQGTTKTTFSVPASPGRTYCFAIRARDKVGNTSGWSQEWCGGTPIDDRSLSASPSWTRGTSANFHGGTYTSVARAGATLSRSGFEGRVVGVVYKRCHGCGTVRLYVNGLHVTEISTDGPLGYKRAVLGLLSRHREGVVTLRTMDDRPVYVDGFVLLRK